MDGRQLTCCKIPCPSYIGIPLRWAVGHTPQFDQSIDIVVVKAAGIEHRPESRGKERKKKEEKEMYRVIDQVILYTYCHLLAVIL